VADMAQTVVEQNRRLLLAKALERNQIRSMKTLTVSQARNALGEVLDQALAGQTIVILRNDQSVLLQPCQIPAPVPSHPAGYFDDCYTDKVECDLENRCAVASA
jgi:hypothetical protein